MNNKLEIYCVTNKKLSYLENFDYNFAAVGTDSFSDKYIKCNYGDNIFNKEKYYSELTFQYWYWKNKLDINQNNWLGFCQKRRFWIKKNSTNESIDLNNFHEHFLKEAPNEWENYDSIICNPIEVNNVKKMKMIKRGFKSIIKNPSIFYDKNKRTINLHFDMHHGYGNLHKAIDVMEDTDREEFRHFVNTSTSFNPHIIFITKPLIADKWFESLFLWLFNCEKIFGFQNLKGYDTQRLYAYLAERYLSFWFNKHTKTLNWPWVFFDPKI